MDLELKEKVAAITGGSVGIGLAVAEGLAAEGVHLVLAARQEDRVKTEANRTAEKFKVRAIGAAADVATVPGTQALIRAAETEFSGADILINNAGTGLPNSSYYVRYDIFQDNLFRIRNGMVA